MNQCQARNFVNVLYHFDYFIYQSFDNMSLSVHLSILVLYIISDAKKKFFPRYTILGLKSQTRRVMGISCA